MTTLTVRGLDDKVIERLKERARIRRRSLEAELRVILIEASSQTPILDALAEADRIAAMTPRKPLPSKAAAPLQMGGEP
jgi:plasmid stability protein